MRRTTEHAGTSAHAEWRASAAAALRGPAEALRVLGRGVLLLLSAAPATGATYVALVVLLGLLPVAQIWLIKVVVDRLAAAATDGSGLGGAMAPATACAATLVAVAGLTPVVTTLWDTLRDHAFADVDRRLMRAGERLVDLYRIERPAFQDELKLISAVVWQWQILLWLIQTGVGTTITLAGVLLLLGRLSPWLPFALAALTVPSVVMAQRLHALRTAAMVRHSRAAREMEYYARVATEPDFAKESHAALVAAGGRYATLYEMQAGRYR